MYLVGCLYYLYQWCTVKQITDNEINVLIKYIKSVLWRVAKRMSYVEEAWCLKGKGTSKVGALSRMCTGIVTDFCELINYLINKWMSVVFKLMDKRKKVAQVN